MQFKQIAGCHEKVKSYRVDVSYMVSHETCYLVIPKEKARRIITADVKYLSVYKNEDDTIKIGYNKGPRSASDNWRVSLCDYKFKGERVETPDGSMEKGLLGTKMNYRDNKTSGTDARSSVSKYIETG